MVEQANPRQIPGDKPRRVFFSRHLELIVWYQSEDWKAIHGVQLCFGDFHLDHVVTAVASAPPTLDKLDEGRRLDASVLRVNGAWRGEAFWRDHGAELSTLPPDILAFVQEKLAEL